jgi:P27 family predicted phage terminase small subunit
VAKGRPRDPARGRSHSSGHRAQTGEAAPVELVPVPKAIALRAPPPDIGPVAADTWRVILGDMAALRTLREVDLPLVLAFCQAAQVHAEASRIVTEKGVLVKGSNGAVTNPLLKVQKDAATTMRQLSDVLGLNPLARIRGNLMEAAAGSMVLEVQKRLRELLE